MNHKNAYIRYKIIDRRIRAHKRPPNIEDLVNAVNRIVEWKVCRSTIEKDLQAMRNDIQLGFHAPIVFDSSKKGFVYTDSDFMICHEDL